MTRLASSIFQSKLSYASAHVAFATPTEGSIRDRRDRMNTPSYNDKKVAEATAAIQDCLEYHTEEAQLADNLKSQLEIKWEDLREATGKLEDYKAEVQDPLDEMNMGTNANPRITYVS